MATLARKVYREILNGAKKLVEAQGGSCHLDTNHGRGRHAKLIISINGKKRITPVSCSGRGDELDVVQCKLADVRRILREERV